MKFYLGSDYVDDTMKALVAAIPVIVIAVVPTLLGCNFFTPKINIVEKWAKQHGKVTQGHLKSYKTYGYSPKRLDDYCTVVAEYEYRFENGKSGTISTTNRVLCRSSHKPDEVIPVYMYKDKKVYASGSSTISVREFFIPVILLGLWAFFYHVLFG